MTASTASAADRAPGLGLTGRFVDAAGQPIADAYVWVRQMHGPLPSGRSYQLDQAKRTAPDGAFSIRLVDLPADEHAPELHVNASFVEILAYADDGRMAWRAARAHHLQADDTVTLQALPDLSVSGRVVDAQGAPVVGATVAADHYTLPAAQDDTETYPPQILGRQVNFYIEEWRQPGELLTMTPPEPGPRRRRPATVTDADGRFTLHGLPDGANPDLVVDHPRFAVYTLAAVDIADEPIVLQPAARVTLTLRAPDGLDPTGAWLILEPDRDTDTAPHTDLLAVDAAGRASFERLPPGSYIIRLLRLADSTLAMPALRVADLAPGESREQTAPCVAGAVLHGRVATWFRGRALRHAEVRFESTDGRYPPTGSNFQAAYTDADGRYRFAFAIAPGEIRLHATWRNHAAGKHKSSRILHLNIDSNPLQEQNFRL